MPRYGIVIDLRKCQGCKTCQVACKFAHHTPQGVSLIKVKKGERGTYPNVTVDFSTMQCMHCGNAPCVDVCPTGATFQDSNGVVDIHRDQCMGCRYCVIACPYGARTFVEKVTPYYAIVKESPFDQIAKEQHQAGVVEKCDMCRPRVAAGQEPACVAACPVIARYFGDLDDPNSEVRKLIAQRHGFQLLAETGTDPSVYYLPV
jgi:Fe-S-cluster-containing dehydrogenase component